MGLSMRACLSMKHSRHPGLHHRLGFCRTAGVMRERVIARRRLYTHTTGLRVLIQRPGWVIGDIPQEQRFQLSSNCRGCVTALYSKREREREREDCWRVRMVALQQQVYQGCDGMYSLHMCSAYRGHGVDWAGAPGGDALVVAGDLAESEGGWPGIVNRDRARWSHGMERIATRSWRIVQREERMLLGEHITGISCNMKDVELYDLG